MTLVVGTAGHIDHGKTALLRALTGIDADRLPEEQRRGMTIDVGYAHLTLPDGSEIDFVDVPGHDRLVGNMLVGAGEIDAVMLVVAADDGPRPQTLEHLELLDALGIATGLAVVTKTDAVGEVRFAEVLAAVARLLEGTTLAGVPVLAASSLTSEGIDAVRAAVAALRDRVEPREGPARLAIDRTFSVRGRGAVVTGTLRGGPLAAGDVLRLVPGERKLRVREVQVHGRTVASAGGGRTALNVAAVDAGELRRGLVLTNDADVVATDRLLVALRSAARGRLAASDGLRLHVGTEAIGAAVRRAAVRPATADTTAAALLRLEAPIAAAPGDRFVLRDPAARSTVAGGVVLDADPPRGISRRRMTPDRLVALEAATAPPEREAARLVLHGVLGGRIAPDVAAELVGLALRTVADHHQREPDSVGPALVTVRGIVAHGARRLATLRPARAEAVAAAVIETLVRDGRLVREAEQLRSPGRAGGLPASLAAAMDRLEAALAVPAPPSIRDAARAVGCPPEGIRALEASGRIVRLELDLAYAATTLRDLEEQALTIAATGPLTPAAFRDATGTSRRYVLAILEDLDRREILRRTPDGHVPGPRAPVAR